MAGYPTIGLNVDLNQIAQLQESLVDLKKSYTDVGQAAAATSQKASASARDEADAYRKAMDQMAADAQRVMSFRMAMYEQERTESAAASAAARASADASRAAGEAATGASVGVKTLGNAHADLGIKALTAREALVMVREAARGDFTRFAGSATIFAQSLGMLNATTIPLLLTFGAITAAVAAFGGIMEKGEEQAASFNRMQKVTGDYAAMTTSAYFDMAKAVAQSTDQSIGASQKTVAALASSGRFTSDTIKLLSVDAMNMAVMTGQSTDKVVEGFIRMSEGVYKYAATFNEQYHALSGQQLEHIRLLEEMGDKSAAEHELAKELYDYLGNDAVKNLGIVEQAWNNLKNTISGVLDSIRQVGRAQTLSEQVGQLNAQIASVEKTGLLSDSSMDGTEAMSARVSKSQLADMKKQRDTLMAELGFAQQQKTAQSDDDARQNAYTRAGTDLRGDWARFGGNKDLAQEEIDKKTVEIGQRLAADPKDKMALDITQNWDAYTAAIRKKYDRMDQPKKGRGAGQLMSAERGLGLAADKEASLSAQLGNPDSGPPLDAQAKIKQAYKDGLVEYEKTTNVHKQMTAAQYAAIKADVERLTILNQLANGHDKATQSEKDHLFALQAAGAATQTAEAALQAYYATGVSGLDGLHAALMTGDAALLKSQHDIANHAIAAKDGAQSVDGIAAAWIAAARANGTLTSAVEKEAYQLQAKAQAELTQTDITNAAALAQERATDAVKATTAAMADVAAINQYAAALAVGTLALASFNREQALAAEQKAHPGLSPTEVAANVDSRGVAEAGRLTVELAEQRRLSALSSQDRALEARQAQLEAGALAAAGKSLSQMNAADAAILVLRARQTAELERQKGYLDAFEGAAKDAIRQAFIDTGGLDFSRIGDLFEKELRRAVYDALLAKPIEIVIKAEKQALSDIEAQITQSAPDLAKALGKGLEYFGKISGEAQAGAGAAEMLGFKGNSNKQAQQFADMAASALGNAVGGPVGGAIASAITHIIGSFIGPKPSNFTANAVWSNGQYSLGGDSPNDQTSSAIAGIASSVQSDIQALQKLGINASQVIANLQIGQRDPGKLVLNNGQTIETGVGNTDALTHAAEKALLTYASYKNPSEKALVDQMEAANRSFSDITGALQTAADALKQLKDFGVTGSLTQAELALIQSGASGAAGDIAGARNLGSSLNLQNLQYTDPTQYALKTLQQQQIQRRNQVQSYLDEGLITADQVPGIEKTLEALEKNEIAASLNQVSTAAQAAAQKLADMTNAQKSLVTYLQSLKVGALSPLSPADQLGAARSQYYDALNKAKGGDTSAAGQVQGLLQTYLQQAQSFYASGPNYAALYDQATADAQSFATQTFDFQQQTADNTAQIDAAMGDLLDAVHGGFSAPTKLADDSIGQLTGALSTGFQSVNDQLANVAQSITDAVLDSGSGIARSVGQSGNLQGMLNGGMVSYV